MKIIFLDIDGVLVTRRIGCFEENLLRNLKRVVDETGATIVLSSDWRRHPQARLEAKRVLGTVGLTFVACTPSLSAYIAQRPTEIMQWKRDYTKRCDAERISNWIAIDDRPLLEERHGHCLRGHFVQTQPLRGLVESVADECIKLLNQEPPPAPPPKVAGLAGIETLLETPAQPRLIGSSIRGSSTGAATRTGPGAFNAPPPSSLGEGFALPSATSPPAAGRGSRPRGRSLPTGPGMRR
mmetsp:Transcript_107981/g.170607  ORF Transcript_107981/g.170607 Transcript_107981/m.170607 type:complete len:239 (-) Transcript_107981:55-771(-)